MRDYSTNPICFVGDHSVTMLRRVQIKTPPPAPGPAGRGQLRYWHRRVSVIELLVALGIIFLALVRIVTAGGDETTFSPTPMAEMRSLSLRPTDH